MRITYICIILIIVCALGIFIGYTWRYQQDKDRRAGICSVLLKKSPPNMFYQIDDFCREYK